MESEEIEVNLIDNGDEHDDNNMFLRHMINRTNNNDETNDAKQNMKSKWEWKWKKKRQNYKYSRKSQMKRKLAAMIMNATKDHYNSEEDVMRENKTNGILTI